MFTDAFIAQITAATATVLGITEIIKRLLKLNGTGAVVTSVLLSFIVALPGITEGVIYYINLAVFTALSANGIFKAVHTPRR